MIVVRNDPYHNSLNPSASRKNMSSCEISLSVPDHGQSREYSRFRAEAEPKPKLWFVKSQKREPMGPISPVEENVSPTLIMAKALKAHCSNWRTSLQPLLMDVIAQNCSHCCHLVQHAMRLTVHFGTCQRNFPPYLWQAYFATSRHSHC